MPSPLADITIDDYERGVVGTVRRARRHGPVILVGHSEGGVSLSPVANVVPHLIDRLVYIAGMCCVDLPSVSDYLATPEGGTSLSAEIGRYGAVGDADARGRAGRWGRVPRTYVRFTEDLDLPLALQDRMIAEADRRTPGSRFDVRSVAAPHSGPMHRPEVVAVLDEVGRRAAHTSAHR